MRILINKIIKQIAIKTQYVKHLMYEYRQIIFNLSLKEYNKLLISNTNTYSNIHGIELK